MNNFQQERTDREKAIDRLALACCASLTVAQWQVDFWWRPLNVGLMQRATDPTTIESWITNRCRFSLAKGAAKSESKFGACRVSCCRAERIIEENVVKAIGLADVASAAGVSARSFQVAGETDRRHIRRPRHSLTALLYAADRTAALGAPRATRPLHWEDLEAFIQPKVEGVMANIAARGSILQSISTLRESLEAFAHC